MERKTKFKALVSGAGKTARNLLDNAVQTVDQNDDGKFDFTDVSVIAESMGSTVKKRRSGNERRRRRKGKVA